MSEPATPKPTDAELEILRILWLRGPCTVRDVHEVLHQRSGTGYTTALKLLQVMHDKHLVLRDESQRAHVYRAAVSRERTQRRFVTDVLQRLFDGSPSRLVLQALGDHRTSPEEIRRIRELLDRLDHADGKQQ